MIHLLFTVIFSECAVILLLLFKTPLRKFLIMGLDKVKRGKGPVVVKTVAGTILILFATTVHSIMGITGPESEPGSINPTDQILMARHILDASLMGFVLFLGLMVDRLHHYIRELRLLRKQMEAAKKQNRSFDDGKTCPPDETKAMADQIVALKNQVQNLEAVCAAKTDEAKSADAKADALKKQSEGLLMEYDRLQEDNQHLRTQLQELDQSVSHSNGKKNT